MKTSTISAAYKGTNPFEKSSLTYISMGNNPVSGVDPTGGYMSGYTAQQSFQAYAKAQADYESYVIGNFAQYERDLQSWYDKELKRIHYFHEHDQYGRTAYSPGELEAILSLNREYGVLHAMKSTLEHAHSPSMDGPDGGFVGRTPGGNIKDHSGTIQKTQFELEVMAEQRAMMEKQWAEKQAEEKAAADKILNDKNNEGIENTKNLGNDVVAGPGGIDDGGDPPGKDKGIGDKIVDGLKSADQYMNSKMGSNIIGEGKPSGVVAGGLSIFPPAVLATALTIFTTGQDINGTPVTGIVDRVIWPVWDAATSLGGISARQDVIFMVDWLHALTK